jgi:alkylation response protein AidB-like acyl-CoA dehydrogenase
MPNPIFIQAAPRLGNQFEDDPFLRAYLDRVLPREVLNDVVPELCEIGRLAGGELYELQMRDRLNEPRLTQWDPWGNRIDSIELTELWKVAAPLAAKYGLVAIPYEREHGAYSRTHQFAALYLFHPSSDVYTCPLAMSDGAARALLDSGNTRLIERALPRLTSRDPLEAWTSGQWMTESTGGSDVGLTRTTAEIGPEGDWRLFGKKWFTSATTAQMALTLARPEGNGPGGSNLAMFYVEVRDGTGRLNNIRIERLKDKLGTRKVPTAELLLDGTRAQLVGEARGGTRAIEPMLVITRAWNSVSASSCMRRGMALANAYARERHAFGKRLSEQPLHIDTLEGLEAETRGAFLLTFEFVRLLGQLEGQDIGESERALLRLLTPISKLTTGKQAVAVVSEVVECFGGAGYVEDTGLATLLRDTQVLPIWEGTTNVLALDALLRSDINTGLAAMKERVAGIVESLRHETLKAQGQKASAALEHATQWLMSVKDAMEMQSGARRFALTLGRAFELSLLVEHARWAVDQGGGKEDVAMAVRFGRTPVDCIHI